MKIDNKALVLDLIEWVAKRPRPYTEVMDAWRTSCPRLPIWEDAIDHGLITQVREGAGEMVRITSAGEAFLRSERRSNS